MSAKAATDGAARGSGAAHAASPAFARRLTAEAYALGFDLFGTAGAASFDLGRNSEFGFVDSTPDAATNGWRKLHRPGAWFGLVHGQVLTLAAYDGALLAALRSAVVPPGADRDWLESHVAREALRVGVGRPERLQLCGTAPRSWGSHEGRLKFACTLLEDDNDAGRSGAVRLACTGSPA